MLAIIVIHFYTNRCHTSTGKSKDTMNTHWLEETGGINGELYGLEAESFPIDRLLSLIETEFERLKALKILVF